MANNVIELIVKVTDKASGALKGLTGKLGGLNAVIGGIGVGVGIAYLTKNIIEAERSTIKLDVAFRNMGKNVGLTRKQLDEMSTSLQQTTTANDDAIKEAQALLLNFDSVTGTVFERTIKVANDMSVALGTDVVSATQKLGLALQSPADGLSRLSRSGVKLSTDMEAVIKQLAATGQTAKAQSLLLDELEKRFGGVATAARDTLGGALTGLKNQIDELFEGDGSSFGGAVASVNDLTKTLQNPDIKAAIDSTIAGLARTASALATVTSLLINGSVAWAEYFAALSGGSLNPTAKFDELIKRNTRSTLEAKQARDELQRQVTNYGQTDPTVIRDLAIAQKKYNALVAEGAMLQKGLSYETSEASKKIQAERKMRGLEDIVITAKPIDTTGADAAAKLKADAAAKSAAEATSKLASLRSSTLAGLAKTFEEWRQSEVAITSALNTKAISAAEAKISIDALNESIRASVLPEDMTSGKAFMQQWELIIGALERGKISAEEAGAALIRLREDALLELIPATDRAAIQWERMEQRIKQAVADLGLDAEVAKRRLKELLDENLENITVTTPRIVLTPVKKEVSEFSKQAARNIQDAFAQAFLSIGQGGNDVFKKLLDSFRNLLAQMAAAKLAEVIGLDDVLAGRSSDKKIGGVLDTIFNGPRDKNTDTGVDGTGGITGVAEGGATCTATISSEGIAKLGTQVSSTIGETLKTFATGVLGSIGRITGGLWKFITQSLGKIWELIKAAVAAIRGMASSGGGSGGGWIGTVASIVGAFFGASAGGGQIGRGKPRLVGEEGPELIMPMANMKVMNERQAAFAGGGASLTYAPTYHTTFEKASDDKAMAAQFAQFVTRNDEKTKREIMEMLRRNGAGRMHR